MPPRIRKREPSGRRSRAEEDTSVSPAVAKRLLAEAARDVSRAEYGSPFGRLFVTGKLSAEQYQAGLRWNALVADYYRAIGAPLPYPPPGPIASLGTVTGRNTEEDPPVTTAAGRRLLEARRRIEKRMHEAEAALGQGGPQAYTSVRTLCEQDRTLAGHQDLLWLRDGLARLAKHWKLSR